MIDESLPAANLRRRPQASAAANERNSGAPATKDRPGSRPWRYMTAGSVGPWAVTSPGTGMLPERNGFAV
jgi:hypothetical protein